MEVHALHHVRYVQLIPPITRSGCRCDRSDRSHTTGSPAPTAVNGLPRGGRVLGIGGLRLLPSHGRPRRRRAGRPASVSAPGEGAKWAGGAAGIRDWEGGAIGRWVAIDVLPSERKAASTTAAGADTACMAGTVQSGSEPSNGIAATDITSLPYSFSILQPQSEPWATNSPGRTSALRT